ncbi:MAG TPA: HAD family phosphatase [Polyangia bacterium]|jgi:phosphoserine phosphatase
MPSAPAEPAVRPEARPVDLVAFDVDGTLVSHAGGKVVWQLLAERLGCDLAWGRARYARYRKGEITYAEWVDLDVGDWQARGATRAGMAAAIREELSLSPGARAVVHELKARGYHLAVISGTIDLVLDVLFPDHPFDDVYTNRVGFDAAGRIASWQATPYDMDGKEHALRLLAARTGTALARCAFVGDHVNDLSALRLAGLPIAYDPKDETVRAAARVVLPAGGLPDLLALLP